MDGLVEELFRLESLKLKALTLIEAPAYDTTVRDQLHLLASSEQSGAEAASSERLLALSQLMRLNTRLRRNLLSTTLSTGSGYTADGHTSDPPAPGRVSVEA
jgi:hypothetical protein